jgi:hypothetical protein
MVIKLAGILIVGIPAYCFYQIEYDNVIFLSKKVGSTIDQVENEYYRIFPDVKGFQDAQFFQYSEEYIMAVIHSKSEGDNIQELKYFFTEEDFVTMQTRVNLTPPLTDLTRRILSGEIRREYIRKQIESIPEGEYIKISRKRGASILGNYISFEDSIFHVKGIFQDFSIPFQEINRITYRRNREFSLRTYEYWIGIGAVVGLFSGRQFALTRKISGDRYLFSSLVGATLGGFFGDLTFKFFRRISGKPTIIKLES